MNIEFVTFEVKVWEQSAICDAWVYMGKYVVDAINENDAIDTVCQALDLDCSSSKWEDSSYDFNIEIQ